MRNTHSLLKHEVIFTSHCKQYFTVGSRWCNGQTTRLPPRRTGFDFRWGRPAIFACRNRVVQRIFSEISRLFCPSIPALINTHLTTPLSILKTSMLRATKISPFSTTSLIKALDISCPAMRERTSPLPPLAEFDSAELRYLGSTPALTLDSPSGAVSPTNYDNISAASPSPPSQLPETPALTGTLLRTNLPDLPPNIAHDQIPKVHENFQKSTKFSIQAAMQARMRSSKKFAIVEIQALHLIGAALSRNVLPRFGLPIGREEGSRPLNASQALFNAHVDQIQCPNLVRAHIWARPTTKVPRPSPPESQACGLAGVLSVPVVPLQGGTAAGCRSPRGLSIISFLTLDSLPDRCLNKARLCNPSRFGGKCDCANLSQPLCCSALLIAQIRLGAASSNKICVRSTCDRYVPSRSPTLHSAVVVCVVERLTQA
ncbi:hypothetical protein PR048_019554, partial [Dryococelus australis]